jgi:beta-lactamase class A
VKGAKFFVFVLCIIVLLYLLYELSGYLRARNLVPAGTTVAGLDVGGLTEEEARARVEQAFSSPVLLYYGEEEIKLHPHRVEYRLDADALWDELARRRTETSRLKGFGLYLLDQDPPPVDVQVEGRFSEPKLVQFLDDLAQEHDRGMRSPQADLETLTFHRGEPARWLDVEASQPLVAGALNSAGERTVELVVEQGAAPPVADIALLEDLIERRVADFPGIVGVFFRNLETGEELVIHGDVAYAGMSILKVPIMIETYRWLEGEPDEETTKLLRETMITSGNFTANLLLRQIGYWQAGEDSAYAGINVLNASLKRLGMVNTFMATPYDVEAPPPRIVTPANSRTDLTTDPDPYMQTTPFDAGRILEMLYNLSKGGGTLPAAYPGQLTAEEGQAMIDLMLQNHEAILLEGGLPPEARLAHKHGYVADTHADAAIVFTPEVDFVLAVFIYYEQGWLGQLSLPIFADIARASYNYYHVDDPYVPAVEGESE